MLSPEEFLKKYTEDELAFLEAYEIVEFFLQSVDGGYVESIGHFAIPKHIPSFWIFDRLTELVCGYHIHIYSNAFM